MYSFKKRNLACVYLCPHLSCINLKTKRPSQKRTHSKTKWLFIFINYNLSIYVHSLSVNFTIPFSLLYVQSLNMLAQVHFSSNDCSILLLPSSFIYTLFLFFNHAFGKSHLQQLVSIPFSRYSSNLSSYVFASTPMKISQDFQ